MTTAQKIESAGKQGGGLSPPLLAISQVIRKLKDGTYPTEPTVCFCGESESVVLVERDRYTIPHRMVMCQFCGLIRANPRMTQESYRQFYNEEYRVIYDGLEHSDFVDQADKWFEHQARQGGFIREFVEHVVDLHPKVVVDFGCDKGGMLKPFMEDGAEAWGIEISESGRDYAEQKGIRIVSSIDELIAAGVKADLVIMQDIIEHFTDLEVVSKLHDVLSPSGMIFLYTPGLFTADSSRLFQNAHTYQFIAATLEYVMGCLGFEAEFLDERIVSLWRPSGKKESRDEVPAWWSRFVLEHLTNAEKRAMPPTRTRCKFTTKELLRNMDRNLAHHREPIGALRGIDSREMVIVGGGPSVDGQVDVIRELIKKGHALMVIERMYPWCHEMGLIPDYVVSLDASEGVEAGFTHIQPGTKHLLVAATNPVLFDCLKDHLVYVFSSSNGEMEDAQKLWRKHGYAKVPCVYTGGSVTLSAMGLALVLGSRKLHVFGMDCMVPRDGKDYSAHVAGESVKRRYFEITVDDEKIMTCAPFLSFARQFFSIVGMAKNEGRLDDVTVYGESLINKMWDKTHVE